MYEKFEKHYLNCSDPLEFGGFVRANLSRRSTSLCKICESRFFSVEFNLFYPSTGTKKVVYRINIQEEINYIEKQIARKYEVRAI